MVLLTKALEADGKDVWSWHLDAGVKFLRSESFSGVTVAKEPEHRGEHGVAVKTIAWGMPGDSGVTCMLVCALPLPLHTRPRAHRPPGIPCALNSKRAGNFSKTRGAAACEIAKLWL